MNFEQLQQNKTLSALWQYFDFLVETDDMDIIFASSYIRGFLEVTAVDFGDEQQALSGALFDQVNQQIKDAKTELNDVDHNLVNAFWLSLKPLFIR